MNSTIKRAKKKTSVSSVDMEHASLIFVHDVTMSLIHNKLKNMHDYGGSRTYDLWNASLMLWQLSYTARSVRVCDITKLSLVPSIST